MRGAGRAQVCKETVAESEEGHPPGCCLKSAGRTGEKRIGHGTGEGTGRAPQDNLAPTGTNWDLPGRTGTHISAAAHLKQTMH